VADTLDDLPRTTETAPVLGFLDRVAPLLADGESFRWISEQRRRVYAAILHALFCRREAHEHEVLHDELFEDVVASLARSEDEAGDYDALQFRRDIEQLRQWGNVSERVEPTRIRSLSDRSRSKLLLRLMPRASAFLGFLEAEAEPVPVGLRDHSTHLLEDLLREITEARRVFKSAASTLPPQAATQATSRAEGEAAADPIAPATEELLVRGSHLIHEADAKAERIAQELVEFGDVLAEFLVEPFRIQSLVELSTWLERYVERYLASLDERGRKIRSGLLALRRPPLGTAVLAADQCEQLRFHRTPQALLRGSIRIRSTQAALQGLEQFFDPVSGLQALCRRINRRTRDVIRRVQRYVEALRLRNIRTEAIRARTREMFELPDDPTSDAIASSFVESLVAPVACRTDARNGAPERRAAPPRPARRHESLRPTHRGAPLTAKTSRPKERHELLRLRLERLSAFIEQRVLCGRDSGTLGDANLESLADASMLIQSVSAWSLRGGRSREHLRYSLRKPIDGRRARIDASDFVIDLRDRDVVAKPSHHSRTAR